MDTGPRCLGLTGGIGSGKSAALAAFAQLGAAVQSSDDAVHAAYADPAVVRAVAERFGTDVVGPGDEVDRAAVGRAVFGDAEARRFLEELIHPRVRAARQEFRARASARVPPPPLLVCEVPLLFEVGLEDQFDAVLVVTAGEDVRRARVEARGQDFDARRGAQMTEDEKIARADRYVVNDGSLAELEAWVAERFREYARPDDGADIAARATATG